MRGALPRRPRAAQFYRQPCAGPDMRASAAHASAVSARKRALLPRSQVAASVQCAYGAALPSCAYQDKDPAPDGTERRVRLRVACPA